MSTQAKDLTTKTGYLKLRSGGFNCIVSPEEVKDWIQLTLRTDSSDTVVAHTSGDANSGQGVSIPIDGQLTFLLGPGSTLFAGGSPGANVSWVFQPVPYLGVLQFLDYQATLLKKVHEAVDRLATVLEARR